MKKIFFYLSLVFSSQINSQELSLTKALELANSPQIKQSDLEVLKQNINFKIQKSKRLPLIYADANLQRNLIVPVTPVPAIAFNPNAIVGDVTPLKFATDWSAKAGLQFSIDLFNSQNHLNVEQAQNSSKKAVISQSQTIKKFENTIIDLYAQTYLAQQQYEVSLINEEKFKQTLQIILLRNQQGRVTDLEKNNALQKAYELELTANEAEYVLKNKFLQLANYIDISNYDRVSTSVETILGIDLSTVNYDVELLRLDVEAKEIDIKNNKQSLIPKVSLNAFYGTQFFNNQLKLVNSDYWYGNSYVNLSLRIPLTEYFEKSLINKYNNLELDIIKSKLEVLELEKQIQNEQKNNEITNLSKKIKILKASVLIAEKNVSIAQTQLNEGTILISDFNKELEKLFVQNQKLWQAFYDLVVTTIK